MRDIPIEWVQKLFATMQAFYGNKFTNQWQGQNLQVVMQIWQSKMSELTDLELRRGFKALEGREWPPSLPEFLNLCRPTPDPVAAYHEALAGLQARKRGEIGEWSHPAIYWAAVKIGLFDFENQPYGALEGRWKRELEESFKKGRWEEIRMPLPTLPPPPPISKVDAAKALKAIGADKMLKPKNDHLRWARLIIERFNDKDPSIGHLQLKSACEALGMDYAKLTERKNG